MFGGWSGWGRERGNGGCGEWASGPPEKQQRRANKTKVLALPTCYLHFETMAVSSWTWWRCCGSPACLTGSSRRRIPHCARRARPRARARACRPRGRCPSEPAAPLPASLAGCTKATLSHNGKSNFIIATFDVDNERLVGLANEIGAYEGTVKWNAKIASLEVKADGAWSIAVE